MFLFQTNNLGHKKFFHDKRNAADKLFSGSGSGRSDLSDHSRADSFYHSFKCGFTLAELLIVVAIIAVLVGVSIPIFSGHLEKSREAVDFANVRSAWSVLTTAVISESTADVNAESSGAYYLDVELKQAQDGWQTTLPITVAGISSDDTTHWIGSPRPGGKCRVKRLNEATYLYWSGSSISGLENVSSKKTHFWTQKKNSDGTVSIYDYDTSSSAIVKNSIDPITLSEGDSFTIPKSCIVPDGTNFRQGIFAFYFVENEKDANGRYTAIMDSGWIQTSDLTSFTAASSGGVETGIFVDNPDDYYSVESNGENVKFTVTKPEGLTLLINNNTWSNMGTIMNEVYIDK